MGDNDQSQSGSAGGREGSAGANDQTKPGDSQGGTKDNQNGDGGTPKTVSWETYVKTRDDMHKYKGTVRDLETRLGDLEAKGLEEKKDYQSLYEKEKEKRTAAEVERDKVKGWAISTHRFTEVRAEAEKAGIIPAALKDLERLAMDDVEVEVTSTGRFLVNGAKSFVETLKNESPHWFQSTKVPIINGGGGGAPPPGDKVLNAHDVVEAERQWKRGKISRQDYENTHRAFVAQSAKKK